jgi:hypothetical protein
MKVWLDCAACSDGNVLDLRADGDHFYADFMSEDAWIGEEGLLSMKGMQIGSADTYLPHANKSFIGSWSLKVFLLYETQLFGCL